MNLNNIFSPIKFFLMLFICLASLSAQESTEVIKTNRDVWISSYKGETDCNMGATTKMKLKIYHEVALLDFDLTSLKGKSIKEAWLYLKPVGKAVLGLNGGSDVKWLSVSTVSHGWVEGKCSSGYGTDTVGHGATFNESSYKKKNWGWPGAKLWDVTLGNGNTIRQNGQLIPDGKFIKFKLNKKIMGALISGSSHGILLMDGNTSPKVNSFFGTRESGANGPYLKVITTKAKAGNVNAAKRLSVKPAPRFATTDFGAIEISVTVPERAYAYKIMINGKPVDRWQIPFAGEPGTKQKFNIIDLPANKKVTVTLSVVDTFGEESKSSKHKVEVSSVLKVPALPGSDFNPNKGGPITAGSIKVWACPEISKVDPTTGNVLFEEKGQLFKSSNGIWDGKDKKIYLSAAKGETISFQTIVEGQFQDGKVQVSEFIGPGKFDVSHIRYWKNWYVDKYSEYALPSDGTLSCPEKNNKITNQKNQAMTIDIHVSQNTKAGLYQGRVLVNVGKEEVTIPLTIKVYNVSIPDEVHFNPELNTYGGGPGSVGSKVYRESRVLAHYLRCNLNAVPYSQSGNLTSLAPAVDTAGHVKSWTNFDKAYEGLLEGRWFKDNPRPNSKIPTMYLPFCEGWPLKFRKFYHPGKNVSLSNKLKHDQLAKPIEKAMGEDYKKAFKNCVSEFYNHFKEKGWNETVFQFYLNNKPGKGSSIWTLDEPVTYLDFKALNFWGELFKAGINDPDVYSKSWVKNYYAKGLVNLRRNKPTFMYRGDISRYYVQGDLCDGIMNFMYANNGMFKYPRIMNQIVKNAPTVLYTYGTCNNVNRNSWESAAWCTKAFLRNCDGVLPWQTIKNQDALVKGHVEGLIVVNRSGSIKIGDKEYGSAIASFRVHALRRGAQNNELFRLLEINKGWTRSQIALLVSQKLKLMSTFKQRFSDEASAVTFKGLNSNDFIKLKEGVLKLLTK
ncbi:MAG: hypothetical protein COA79_09155 [Planctomycetota bacterium]|nr:MAG: hypothetical protein COA79_09155 [Planctomycetota bacterium]